MKPDRPIRPRPERKLRPVKNCGRPTPTIVCRDCGCEVVRSSTHLACECRVGFVAQWDQSLGQGIYLGRILANDTEGVVA